jgi:Spy/CpxP family protein refolding chaperone
MNTKLSLTRAAFLALALGTASVTASFAQTSTTPTATTTPPTCSGGGYHRHHHESVLTSDEKAQLEKARDAALAANGTLQTEQASLKQQFETLKSQSGGATKDQWQALHQQEADFHAKLRSAELLIDPTLAPIFAKLDAAHQHGPHSA